MTKKKQKEKNVVVRNKLIREINKSKEFMKNIRDEVRERDDASALETVKQIIDELTIFSKESELSEVGHSYPILSPQRSSRTGTIKKLSKFDLSIVEKMQDVTEASKRLHKAVIEGEDIDTSKELEQIHHYISDARHAFRDRTDIIKGVE